MALFTLTRYIETFYEEGSRPDKRTVRGWIKDDILPYHSVKLGHLYYIDPDRPKLSSDVVIRSVIENGPPPQIL